MPSRLEGPTPPPVPEKLRHRPSVGNLASERVEPPAERMARFQSVERIDGQMTDFAPDLGVEVSMGKSLEKRPGEVRGEDMFLADRETGLTGVFDGLSGQGEYQGRGADASVKAASLAPQLYRQIEGKLHGQDAAGLSDELHDVSVGQGRLEHPDSRLAFSLDLKESWRGYDVAVQKEIIALYQTVQKLSEVVKDTKGMTTATLGKTVELPDGRRFEVIASVGDSGATLLGADGRAENITREDSVLDYFISQGSFTPEQAKDPNFERAGMTVRDMKRAMYQAVGNPDSEIPTVPRITIRELQPGDRVLYATDGIRDVIADRNGDFDAARAQKLIEEGGIRKLMDTALSGAKKDECTALLKEAYAQTADDVLEEIGAEDVIEASELE